MIKRKTCAWSVNDRNALLYDLILENISNARKRISFQRILIDQYTWSSSSRCLSRCLRSSMTFWCWFRCSVCKDSFDFYERKRWVDWTRRILNTGLLFPFVIVFLNLLFVLNKSIEWKKKELNRFFSFSIDLCTCLSAAERVKRLFSWVRSSIWRVCDLKMKRNLL